MNIRVKAIIITTMASFLSPFVLSATNVALPKIGMEFLLDTATIGWIQNAFLLATAAILIPVGRWTDAIGRKKVLLLGLIIYAIASLMTSISPSAFMLIFSRIIQGVGGAMLATTSIAIITSVFLPHERGKFLGINAASIYLAIACGPFFGGMLTELMGWRSIFAINFIIALIIIIITYTIKQEWKGKEMRKFDLQGSILYGISLIAIIFGMTSVNTLITAIGLIFLIIFIVWENRIAHPILEVKIFIRNRAFSFASFSALINYSATYALSFIISLYLQIVRGLSAGVAGTILLFQPIVQAILSPMAGRLSDKFSPRKIASMGMGMNSIGLFLFSTLKSTTEISAIIMLLIFMGIGFAFFASPNTNAIMSSVKSESYGMASATLSLMRVVGQTLSIALATLILSIFVGPNLLNPLYMEYFMSGARFSFLTFSAMCLFGTILSALGTMKKNK
ncbi:MAG: MFS transporter [Candidatus Methanomethyliaceae archaeon]|nr:MFS transporter [Candidatus Methanomethyliaceae archaeon]MDW7971551.1 MFS transporter [Nitrososphaerota archaeon]